MAKREKRIIIQTGEGEDAQSIFCCASGEGLTKAIELALSGREQSVMVRVNDEILRHLDMLTESGITKSRSSAATFMIREGIKANEPLFDRISSVTDQVAALKEQLKDLVQDLDETEED